jgi:hypothetical protein
MHRRLPMTVLLVLLCLAAVACGGRSSASSSTAIAPTSTSTTEQISAFPGSYVTSLTKEEIKSGGGTDMTLAGEWIFTFAAAQGSAISYEAVLNGARAWQGTMVVDGDQIKISTEDLGKGEQGDGSYTWSFDGTQLSFTAVSDVSLHRKLILTERPMVRRP